MTNVLIARRQGHVSYDVLSFVTVHVQNVLHAFDVFYRIGFFFAAVYGGYTFCYGIGYTSGAQGYSMSLPSTIFFRAS